MSLFPAYAENDSTKCDKEQATKSTSSSSEWLTNSSFPIQLLNLVKPKPDEPVDLSSSFCDDPNSDDNDNEAQVATENTKGKRKSKSKKKHKKKRKKDEEVEKSLVPVAGPSVDTRFKDSDDFYEDVKAVPSYKNATTLYRPAIPKYKLSTRVIIGSTDPRKIPYKSRYYKEKFDDDEEALLTALPEDQYLAEQGQFNRKILESPSNLTVWLDYIKLHDRNPYKWPRLYLADKKMELIERALKYHPSNDDLYRAYFEAITDTFPAFEVAKFLDKLINKDPYSYILWTSQIMTTQGSMARCVVPDVLRIYEKCMQKMHLAQKKNKMLENSDSVMLKLFNNCALFMRQAGLLEQFFALIKLALELNVSAVLFGDFAPKQEDENTLIEYEEVILQSGLPMNEIWLRIEKLRQGFNFLPMPENSKCSDPQRIVFNEDVCYYIYPLKEKENAFFLMLLIVKLLKIPFIQNDVTTVKFIARVEHIGDSDAIEDMLSVLLRKTFVLPMKEQNQFFACLLDVTKEMATTPSFLSNIIGHEIYVRTVNEILINCAESFTGINERKRIVFLSLWCKFERILLILHKLQGKLTPAYIKEMKSRYKSLLKQKANRNVLNIFTEFAICEYETLGYEGGASLESVTKMFDSILEVHFGNEAMASDLSHIYLIYTEILIGCQEYESALQVLTAYATNSNKNTKGSFSSSKKLAGLRKLQEKVVAIMEVEKKVEIMVLEQYLLPDHSLSLLKMYCFMLCLLGQKAEALKYLGKLLDTFLPDDNDRHNYLRESIMELEIIIHQLAMPGTVVSPALLNKKVIAALAAYPRNLFFLQTCGMLISLPSYKLKSAMLSSSDPTIQAIIFFIASHRLRFINKRCQNLNGPEVLNDLDRLHNESIVRYRILNMFKDFTEKINSSSKSSSLGQAKFNALRRNALFWRFYLSCLSDKQTSFEVTKSCLLMALDECPWNKALYLDGATYVPQELPHLQDLMIEKQLRLYAIPEELEILREK